MNTKDKASELILKFAPYMYCYMGSGMLANDYDKNVVLDFAKKCATISVKEILRALRNPPTSNEIHGEIDYWNEVGALIETLTTKDIEI